MRASVKRSDTAWFSSDQPYRVQQLSVTGFLKMLFWCEVVLNGHSLAITILDRGFITFKNVWHMLWIRITGGCFKD